ncbi:TlyA family rRNA (cytidine-2'-O)-methyltransferase [soil metagenome]
MDSSLLNSRAPRLDTEMAKRGLVTTRSQAESYIKLGQVKVNGKVVAKSGQMVRESDEVTLAVGQQYVSRAAHKLGSVVGKLGIDFRDKLVLDVGSSTGGFTDYALRHGAKRVIAVDVGTDQLHPSLRDDPRIELHEKTDIRDFVKGRTFSELGIDLVLIDVSFVSLRAILPAVYKIIKPQITVVAMVKPQFEATESKLKHKGVIKNDRMRRDILKDFESWVKNMFVIADKADSDIAGAKGNKERFYILLKANRTHPEIISKV